MDSEDQENPSEHVVEVQLGWRMDLRKEVHLVSDNDDDDVVCVFWRVKTWNEESVDLQLSWELLEVEQ